jgi:PilZ domain
MTAITSRPAPALNAGQQVTVNLAHLDTVPATVESSEGATVKVALTVRDDRIARVMDREIFIELISGTGIYRHTGVLKSDKGGLLTVAMTGAVERIQRREFVRVATGVPVVVTGVGEDIGGETTTVDLSGRGLRVLDPWQLPLGLEVRLEIKLPDGPLHALGRVVREAGEGERGISFSDLPRADEDRVIRYIRERELQALRAKRNVK